MRGGGERGGETYQLSVPEVNLSHSTRNFSSDKSFTYTRGEMVGGGVVGGGRERGSGSKEAQK